MARLVRGGPDHARARHAQSGRGQDIIHPPCPHALPDHGIHTRQRILHSLVRQQRADHLSPPLPSVGVEVRIARQHEGHRGRASQCPVEVVAPQRDLVRIAQPVAVLRPVKDRRSGMKGQHIKAGPIRQHHRHHPMRRGRQPLNLLRLGRGKWPAIRVHRQPRPRQVGPEQGAEIAHLPDRKPREHGEPALPRERPIALRIPRPAHPPVAIEVQPARQPRVGLRGKPVRQRQTPLRNSLGQRRQGDTVKIPVDPLQGDDIGPGQCDHLGHRSRLCVPRPDVAQHQPRTLAAQFGVECGNADGLRPKGRGYGDKAQKGGRGAPEPHAVCAASALA